MCLWADSCAHAQILGEPEASVGAMLDLFGVHLKPSELRKDVKPLLKTACSAIFGSATGLVDMLTQHVPSSRAGVVTKVRTCRPRQGPGVQSCAMKLKQSKADRETQEKVFRNI